MQFFFQQLEQEKHRLRCELEVMEDEYEQRITELQSDLSGIYKNYFNTFLQNCNNLTLLIVIIRIRIILFFQQ